MKKLRQMMNSRIFRIGICVVSAFFAFSYSQGLRAKNKKNKSSEKVLKENNLQGSAPLSLTEYLGQVRRGHKSFDASEEQKRASGQMLAETKMTFSPQVEVTSAYIDDKSPATSFLSPVESKTFANTLAVSQYFSSGQQVSVSFTAAEISATLFPMPAIFPPTTVPKYSTSTTLQVNNPLWKNAGASEIHAVEEFAGMRAKMTDNTQDFSQKLIYFSAELAYWRLVLARETIILLSDTLERQKKLQEWVAERVQRHLGDDSDFLQTSVAVKAREVELKMAHDEERSAIRVLNSLRGFDNQNANFALESLPNLEELKAPAKPQGVLRLDVAALATSTSMVEKTYEVTKEKFTPKLDLFASATLAGNDNSLATSTRESFQTKNPKYSIGLNFSMPLAAELVSDHKTSALSEKSASKLAYERKKFEVEREWEEVSNQLADSLTRLTLMTEMESVQKQKLDVERDRHKAGRSTLFQVLTYENDYVSAKLSRVRTHADILRILAQLKTFGDKA